MWRMTSSSSYLILKSWTCPLCWRYLLSAPATLMKGVSACHTKVAFQETRWSALRRRKKCVGKQGDLPFRETDPCFLSPAKTNILFLNCYIELQAGKPHFWIVGEKRGGERNPISKLSILFLGNQGKATTIYPLPILFCMTVSWPWQGWQAD